MNKNLNSNWKYDKIEKNNEKIFQWKLYLREKCKRLILLNKKIIK